MGRQAVAWAVSIAGIAAWTAAITWYLVLLHRHNRGKGEKIMSEIPQLNADQLWLGKITGHVSDGHRRRWPVLAFTDKGQVIRWLEATENAKAWRVTGLELTEVCVTAPVRPSLYDKATGAPS